MTVCHALFLKSLIYRYALCGLGLLLGYSAAPEAIANDRLVVRGACAFTVHDAQGPLPLASPGPAPERPPAPLSARVERSDVIYSVDHNY